MRFDQLARYTIGMVWIYHGIFPKLLHIAPLEKAMTGSLGFSDDASFLITKAAGVLEILFGIIFIVFYRYRVIQLLNITALAALLVFATIMIPSILFEAFNPVTTNLPVMVLSVYLLSEKKRS